MAGTYGIVNLISSFGFAAFWRRQCVRQIHIDPGMSVIDLMTGMGELLPALSRRVGRQGRIRAIDLSPVMCRKANAMLSHRKISGEIVEDNVLTHSMCDGVADVVVSSFGLKTFSPDQRSVLAKKIHGLLKPGGRFSLVEISVPPSPLMHRPYMFYLKFVIPWIGRLFLGNPDNYRMLGVYTEAFQNCNTFVDELHRVGLDARPTSYFFGCATGITGFKPREDTGRQKDTPTTR